MPKSLPRRLILSFLSMSLIAGCGFQLRGNFTMPESLSVVSIDGGDRQIVQELSDLLVASGSQVVDAGTENASRIEILRSDYTRDVRTVDANNIATGFDYRYEVDFRVSDAAGKELQEIVQLSQLRTLDYEAGNELVFEDEEEFLREQMEREVALQMMRRLARL